MLQRRNQKEWESLNVHVKDLWSSRASVIKRGPPCGGNKTRNGKKTLGKISKLQLFSLFLTGKYFKK